MKIGIILPCHNIEKQINVAAFLYFLKHHSKFHLCFINNGSFDKTKMILEKIKRDAAREVSIIDIKKKKNKVAVIRAGIRYLNSRIDLGAIELVEIDYGIKYSELKTIFFNVLERNNKQTHQKTYGLDVFEKKMGNSRIRILLLLLILKTLYL